MKTAFSYAARGTSVAALALGLTGCFQIGDAGVGGNPQFIAPRTTPLVGQLERAVSCQDLVSRLRADAITKLETAAWRAANSEMPVTGGVWDAGIALFPGAIDNATGAPSAGAPSHTETNTQVAGVDEADFVETDGLHVYLLHGRDFFVLDAVPLGSVTEGARVRIEGQPSSMFVADGRAVVFSSVGGTYYGGYPNVDSLPPFVGPVPTPVPVLDGGSAMDAPYWTSPGTSEVKITVLDVSSATPTIVSERYIEGSYVDARRHGDVVRVVVQSYTGSPITGSAPSPWDYATGAPIAQPNYVASVATWRDEQRALIMDAPLEAFVARQSHAEGEARVDDATDCQSYLVPQPGESADGSVRVFGFSLANPSAGATTTIVGMADTVYANGDVLLLAQHDYRWNQFGGVASEQTALHSFTLDGISAQYEGSGAVLGSIRDQFSLDEKGGVVRVVATEQHPLEAPQLDPRVSWFPTEARTHVLTLARSATGMRALGTTGDLAPGEALQSVRFVNDRAYVVTFRRVDPLFVIDLADPAHVTVLGELKIPGFSTYIHPLDANHLLTIGRQVPESGVGDEGMALQVFDVTNAAAPTLLHKLVLPSANSSAEFDHKAFVFDQATGLLAVPVTSYGVAFESALQIFHVSVADGFSSRGSVRHDGFFDDCLDPMTDYYVCGYGADMRRGLFIGSYVYSVSYRGVAAHSLSDLTIATGSYALPAPEVFYYAW